MARIFINCRRDDTLGVAGRLSDYLALKYSRRELFMDVNAMQPGRDFAKQLDSQVAQCQVLLAMIGPHWLDARDQAGKRRLDNDRDYVRPGIHSHDARCFLKDKTSRPVASPCCIAGFERTETK
jgi:hypothetical protein